MQLSLSDVPSVRFEVGPFFQDIPVESFVQKGNLHTHTAKTGLTKLELDLA